MGTVNLGIVGGGWRSEFFLRVVRELPEQFCITGMVVRNSEKGELIEKKWGVNTYRTIDDFLANEDPDFVVVCVPWETSPVVLKELASRKMPALAETPPAPDVEGLIEVHKLTKNGAKIQVAEQYIFQPVHAACLNVIESGRLGTVTQAQVSVAHGYHGISLIRHFLDIGFEEATITAYSFKSPIVDGPGRDGPPTEEKIVESAQAVAHLDFGDKLGVYDFVGDQYFSWVRSPRILIRKKGEINDATIRYLQDFATPIQTELCRADAGHNTNLEGYFHKGILAGGEWLYQNPFVYAKLTDDEIAVATCLKKMAEYTQGGQSFYSIAEAAQDHYLGLMIEKAVKTSEKITAAHQPWAEK